MELSASTRKVVWLWNYRKDYIASFPLHLQHTAWSHLRSDPIQQISTKLNDAAAVRNIFGTPALQRLSVPSFYVFRYFSTFEIFVPLRQTIYLGKTGSHLKPNLFCFINTFCGLETTWQKVISELGIVSVGIQFLGQNYGLPQWFIFQIHLQSHKSYN